MRRHASKIDGAKRQQFMLTRDVIAVARERLLVRLFDDVLEKAVAVDRQHGIAANAIGIDIATSDQSRAIERRQARTVERDECLQHVDRVVVVGVQYQERVGAGKVLAERMASAVPRASAWIAYETCTRRGGRVRS